MYSKLKVNSNRYIRHVERTLNYCGYKPLVKILLEMQFCQVVARPPMKQFILPYYIVGNPEWDNGTRSDVVLEAKSSVLDLPPIIIEIQPTVNSLFIKRAINYSLESFNRHKLDPIVLIICTDTLSSDSVAKDVKTSDIPACYDFPSTGWACNCLIVCERRVPEYTDTMPLNPFIALISFLTSRKLTINCSFYPDDPTIQYLYTLASHLHQNRPGDQHITDILAQADCFSKNEVVEIDGVTLFSVLLCPNQTCNTLWQRDINASRNMHYIV
ncbi:hypothetical protein EDC94DRAFT_644492 [Helicostylum pulchrum]|nr:hypothetical protein EDC94DRAFT_644492 [Helicostylum pulchrum]